MFGTQWTKRRRGTERVAEDAWDNLRSAMDSTAKSARSTAKTARSTAKSAKSTAKSVGRRTQGFADDAQGRLGSAADEARRRANSAVDALAGRRPRTPWAWIAGSAVAGVLLGLAAATAGVKALSAAFGRHSDEHDLDAAMAESTPVATPTPTGMPRP